MLPGLQKIHTNIRKTSRLLWHHEPGLPEHAPIRRCVTFVMGMVLSMEQQKMDIQTIRSVRISVAAAVRRYR